MKIHKDDPPAAPAVVQMPGQPWPAADAAKFLHTTVRTMQKAEKAGTLRLIRIGRLLFVPDDEVRRVAAEGLKTSA